MAITTAITLLYEIPETFPPLLEILTSSPNPTIRHAAAIGLGVMLNKFWVHLIHSGSDAIVPIKSLVIQSLTHEPEFLVRQQVIHSIKPMFPCSDIEQLAFEALHSTDPIVLQTSFELYIIALENLTETSEPVISAICSRLPHVFSSTSDSLRLSACDLIVALMSVLSPPIPTELRALFSEVLILFDAAVRASSALMWPLAHAISESARFPELRADASLYLDALSVLLSSDLSVAQSLPVFSVLGALATSHIGDLDISIPDLVGLLYRWLSVAFIDSCHDAQFDCHFILEEVSSLFPYAWGSLPLEELPAATAGEAYAALAIWHLFIDDAPDQIPARLPHCVGFLVAHAQRGSHHAVREAALSAIAHLIPVVTGGLHDFRDAIWAACVAAVADRDQTVANYAMLALVALATTLEIAFERIAELADAVVALLHAPALSPAVAVNAVELLSALVFGAGEDIAEAADRILPVFLHYGAMRGDGAAQLRAVAIEGIARIVEAWPGGVFVPIAVGHVFAAVDSGDPVVRKSVLTACRLLVKAKVDIGEREKGIAVLLAAEVMAEERPEFLVEGPDEGVAPIYEAQAEALLLVGVIAQEFPEMLLPSASSFYEAALDLVNHLEIGLREAAISCAIELTVAYRRLPAFEANIVLTILNPLFEDDEQPLVLKCFAGVCRLILPDVEFSGEQLSIVLKNAHLARHGRLSCQQNPADGDSQFDLDLLQKVYKFYEKMARYRPSEFPLECYLADTRLLTKKRKRGDIALHHELSLSALPLAFLVQAVGSAGFPEIARKMIFQTVVYGMSLCDAVISPSALRAARILTETDPRFLQENLGAVVAKCTSLLLLENTGSPTFHETVTASAALLWAVFVTAPEAAPQFARFVPAMVILPNHSPADAAVIYRGIIGFLRAGGEEVVVSAAQLLAQTFALRRTSFMRFALPAELVADMVMMLRELLAHPELQEAVRAVVNDPRGAARLQQILQS